MIKLNPTSKTDRRCVLTATRCEMKKNGERRKNTQSKEQAVANEKARERPSSLFDPETDVNETAEIIIDNEKC